jgi:hypothetical protein
VDKFGRNYLLRVENEDGQFLTIAPPFTIEFDVNRNILSSANLSSIRIYNLSKHNRASIRKDQYDGGVLRRVILQAGYGTNLPIIFDGDIQRAWSVREGVNFITQIESFDGGYAFLNGLVNQTFPRGTDQRTILLELLGHLPGTQVGTVGDYPGRTTRGSAYSGNTAQIVTELSGGGFFIDNAKANCLNDSECLRGEIQVITSASGLLGTPVREETFLNFDMLFEPRLVIGQELALDSITGDNFNGLYKVIAIKHKGMISESVCGDAITSVGLAYGLGKLKTVGP